MDAVKEKRYYGWYMVMVSAIIYAPVSYTHLDVYKRQVLNQKFGMGFL